jgi:hypothetical protein
MFFGLATNSNEISLLLDFMPNLTELNFSPLAKNKPILSGIEIAVNLSEGNI